MLLWLCVCMHTYLYAHACLYVHVCHMYTYRYICICTHALPCVYISVHAMCTYLCSIYACTFVQLYVSMPMYVHAYIVCLYAPVCALCAYTSMYIHARYAFTPVHMYVHTFMGILNIMCLSEHMPACVPTSPVTMFVYMPTCLYLCIHACM